MAQEATKDTLTGFVSSLSPTRNLKPQFDVVVQDGASSTAQLKRFLKDTYDKLEHFNRTKSQVKMEILRNPKYKTPTISEDCRLRKLKKCEVYYSYDPGG